MESLLLIIICILLLIAIILIIIFRSKGNNELPELQNKVVELQTSLTKIESNLKDDFRTNREENATIAKDNRTELASNLKEFTLEQRTKFDELKKEQTNLTTKTVEQLEKISGKVEEKLKDLNDQAKGDATLMREALVNAFKGFSETFDKNIVSFNDLQKEKFADLEKRQNELIKTGKHQSYGRRKIRKNIKRTSWTKF